MSWYGGGVHVNLKKGKKRRWRAEYETKGFAQTPCVTGERWCNLQPRVCVNVFVLQCIPHGDVCAEMAWKFSQNRALFWREYVHQPENRLSPRRVESVAKYLAMSRLAFYFLNKFEVTGQVQEQEQLTGLTVWWEGASCLGSSCFICYFLVGLYHGEDTLKYNSLDKVLNKLGRAACSPIFQKCDEIKTNSWHYENIVTMRDFWGRFVNRNSYWFLRSFVITLGFK